MKISWKQKKLRMLQLKPTDRLEDSAFAQQDHLPPFLQRAAHGGPFLEGDAQFLRQLQAVLLVHRIHRRGLVYGLWATLAIRSFCCVWFCSRPMRSSMIRPSADWLRMDRRWRKRGIIRPLW